METTKMKKAFPDRWSFPLLIALLFSLVFVGLYFFFRENAPGTAQIGNETVASLFEKYGPYVGFAVWLISLIGTYLLFFVKYLLWLRSFVILNPLVYLIVYWGLFWLGYWLAHFEPRYTDIARAIIDFFSRPIMYSSSVVLAISVARFFYLVIQKVVWKK